VPTVRALEKTDDRSTFDSGNPALDTFFRAYAAQNQFRHHIGSTYVALDDDRRTILGYATVSAGELVIDALPAPKRKGIPGAYPLPSLRLARLAVARTAQRRGVGRALLRHVFSLAIEMSHTIGCAVIVVDAKDEDAVAYYAQFGFVVVEAIAGASDARPEPTTMVLLMKDLLANL
jgi:GNAT superfamily N-acetyltransferase